MPNTKMPVKVTNERIFAGQDDVSPGTPIYLGQGRNNLEVTEVFVQRDPDQQGQLFVGSENAQTVILNTAYGHGIWIKINLLHKVWVRTENADQTVHWLAVGR